jgi:hypothetical protein
MLVADIVKIVVIGVLGRSPIEVCPCQDVLAAASVSFKLFTKECRLPLCPAGFQLSSQQFRQGNSHGADG